jgi:hypothetical protein
MRTLTEDQWIEEFKPTTEHPIQHEEIADAITKEHVWTLVDGDNEMVIASGYHIVNRVAYYVTNKPHNFDVQAVIPDGE